jgi:hypothetical protein
MNRCYLCGYTHFDARKVKFYVGARILCKDLKMCRARAAKKAADYAAMDPFWKS